MELLEQIQINNHLMTIWDFIHTDEVNHIRNTSLRFAQFELAEELMRRLYKINRKLALGWFDSFDLSDEFEEDEFFNN